jgi:3-oxoacyl-[acyl-carrier-protein] synthase-3
MNVKITGVGHYIPNKIIDNKYLSENYAITSADILKKTGIEARRYVEDGVTTTQIVCQSIDDLLKKTSKKIEDIECIIVGTFTPDFFFPSTAVSVINNLQAINAWGFDLSAACSGFCYSLSVAAAMIKQGTVRNVIVCGAERLSKTINNFDYKTAVLVGDGAGSVLLEATEDPQLIVNNTFCNVVADTGNSVFFKTPFNTSDWNKEIFELRGRDVYINAVKIMSETIKEFLIKNNLELNDFDHIIPHQANLNILSDVAKELQLNLSRFRINIQKLGNTGSASIPLCLSESVLSGTVKKGDRILLVSFGAGYTISIIDLFWSI